MSDRPWVTTINDACAKLEEISDAIPLVAARIRAGEQIRAVVNVYQLRDCLSEIGNALELWASDQSAAEFLQNLGDSGE